MAKRKQGAGGDEELDGLYALPLGEFTAARNALAKSRRDAGDREGSDDVKSLAKPSLPSWAINQGVRSDPKAAKALLAAGERLREAHEGALSGGAAEELREAMGREAEAVETMTRAAEAAAGDERLGPAMLDRVRDTLRTVAGDDELRVEFEAGRVQRDRRPVGLGGAFSPGSGPAKPKRSRGPTAAERKRVEQRVRKARKALDAARKRTTGAAGRAEKARKAMKEAEAAATEAEHEEKLAREELEAAEADQAELA